MSVLGVLTDLQSETAKQAAKDALKAAEEGKKTGDNMGKYDFLMLLSAQLRHQDPLNPTSDADFAAQLAQFSSLEQMQNMNATLSAISNQQSYSLIGKLVVAEAEIDGVFGEVMGVVESIFTNAGVTYAQIGENIVPVSSIKEVFNTGDLLTSEMFMQTADQLIGRTVVGEVDGEEVEGVVTRVLVDKGVLYAQVDVGSSEPKFIPVSSIIDIRETGTSRHNPKPKFPPDAMNFRADGDDFIETSADGKTDLGRWTWSVAQWKWVYTAFEVDGADKPGQPGGDEETDPVDGAGEGSGSSTGKSAQSGKVNTPMAA